MAPSNFVFDKEFFDESISQYFVNCKETDWILKNEAYKFRFAEWVHSKVDFKIQSDGEILQILIQSQEQEYDKGIKGINFIKSALMFKANFINLNEVQLLREIYNGHELDSNDFRKILITVPKFSIWLATLFPDKFFTLPNVELIQSLERLYPEEEIPRKGFFSFKKVQELITDLKVKLTFFEKEINLVEDKIFNNKRSRTFLIWLIQDYLLFVKRTIIDEESNCHLLTWNSYKSNLGQDILTIKEQINNDSYYYETWSVNSNNIYIDERVFLMHVGSEPRGIIGSGKVVLSEDSDDLEFVNEASAVFMSDHWDDEKYQKGEKAKYIFVEWDAILDKDNDKILSYDILKNRFPNQNWTPQSSGIRIRKEYVTELTELWEEFQSGTSIVKRPPPRISFEINDKDIINMNKLDLNTILYGPPGTGKTYKLKNDYFSMFTSLEKTQSHDEFISAIVENLKWWEIIALVVLALKKCSVNDIYEHELFQKKIFLTDNQQPKSIIPLMLYTHTNWDNKFVKQTKRDEPLIFDKTEDDFWHIDLKIVNTELYYLQEIHDKYIKNEYKSTINKRYKFITFHQSYSYEEFIEGLKPILVEQESESEVRYQIVPGIFKELCSKAEKDVGNNYAIFIDEINRGNISKIFGEIITLIEDDKRIGAENELRVTLPYSKEQFGVPKNLYIIGTMNTADRSIALIDVALRRRFSFIELMPDSSQLNFNVNGISIRNLFETINERIDFLYDRDHTLGHAFFLKLGSIQNDGEKYAELCKIFKDKIIPLLQEYFYEDWEKIQIVLGDHPKQLKNSRDADKFDDALNILRFIQSRNYSEKDTIGFDHDYLDSKIQYRINPKLGEGTISPEAFTKIYNQKKLTDE